MAEIKAVAVIGAGTMGHGIAQVAAHAGYQTFLYDVTRELAEKGLRRISANLAVGVEKGKLKPEEKDAALARLTAVDSLGAPGGCDLVIEAIPGYLSQQREIVGNVPAVSPSA